MKKMRRFWILCGPNTLVTRNKKSKLKIKKSKMKIKKNKVQIKKNKVRIQKK